jgi:hypothetical protein
MSNLQNDQDDESLPQPATPDNTPLPLPTTHGQVYAGDGDPATRRKLAAHLQEHEQHLDATSAYGGHGARHGQKVARPTGSPCAAGTFGANADAASQQNTGYDDGD